MALGQGATVHVPPAGLLLAGETLGEVLVTAGITHVTLPPAVLAEMPEPGTLGGVGTMILAGETVPVAVAAQWGPGRRLFNAYGSRQALSNIPVRGNAHLHWETAGTCFAAEEFTFRRR